MAKKKQTPRISVKNEMYFTRLKHDYEGLSKEASTYLNSSLQRFPRMNPHWQYFPTLDEKGDDAYMLKTIRETHYDKKGRPVHAFQEDANGIREESWIYVDLEDGTSVKIMHDSDGSVNVEYKGKFWSREKGQYYFIFPPLVPTPKQKEFMDYQDRIDFGEPATEEDAKEYDRREEEAYRTIVVTKDEYGNPLQEEHWFCDVREGFTDYTYVYDK